MSALIIWVYYTVFSILLLGAIYHGIRVWQRRPSWGQVRYMGVPFTIFIWLQVIFHLVLLDGVYGLVSFIIGLPLWLDLAISVVIFVMLIYIYLSVSDRQHFKPSVFISLILIPLGFTALPTIADMSLVGSLRLSRVGLIAVLTRSDGVQERIAKETVGGLVHFANTHAIGRVGDALTAKKLTAMGYKKEAAKYDQIHGIDGVYVSRLKGDTVGELLIIENKVDTGRMDLGTLSDTWIKDRARKMVESGNQDISGTGQLILDILERYPERIKRQLWHHDLRTGTTRVTAVNSRGVIELPPLWLWEDNFIRNHIRRWCSTGSLVCSNTN